MSKNILNEELNQMKYLFGYKAGKVISEQENQPSPEVPTKTETPQWKLKLTNNPQDLGVFLRVGSEDLKPAGLLTKAIQDYSKSQKTLDDRKAYTATMNDIAYLVKPMLTMAYQEGLDGVNFKQTPDDKIMGFLARNPKPEGLTDWNVVIEQQFSNLANLKNLVGNLIDIKIKNLGV